MQEDRVFKLLVTVLTACAVTVTALLVRREFSAKSSRPEVAWTRIRGENPDHEPRNVIGAMSAPVTLVEYSDFECPFCGALHQSLAELARSRPGDVRVLYRHFPLTSIHRFAMRAAIASECAANQDRFQALHDLLFENQDSLGILTWDEFAKRADVPSLPQFSQCMQDPASERRVRQDIVSAGRLNVTATPTLFVGGFRYTGVPSLSALDSIVDAEKTRRGGR